ncbi:hypothetical protein AAL_06326 [Moelleriella libera RCEF 2490]|uniref:Uncharacterized protein n=1 Tax=Moelleriella libera RCEF 2490 TaxID=1081109 RepID=A0A167Z3K5_9HYPO|nr:hypothetical protein AAL_06326 [Moelleriella libera RCEF 2490]
MPSRLPTTTTTSLSASSTTSDSPTSGSAPTTVTAAASTLTLALITPAPSDNHTDPTKIGLGIGLGLGVLSAVGLLAVLIFLLTRHKRLERGRNATAVSSAAPSDGGSYTPPQPASELAADNPSNSPNAGKQAPEYHAISPLKTPQTTRQMATDLCEDPHVCEASA